MRRRRSSSLAWGAWNVKGRMASALIVPISESRWLDVWFGRAAPSAAKCVGKRLVIPVAAETTRTLRRVGDDGFLVMTSLPGSSQAGSGERERVSRLATAKMIRATLEANRCDYLIHT